MKNSLTLLMLSAALLLGLCQTANAQSHRHYHAPQMSLTEYMVQVRVNPTNKFAAHFRGPFVTADRLSYHFTEFDSQQEALDWAADNPAYILLGVYAVDPAPTNWETVQVENNYGGALDAWYEIIDNTDGLEVRIKSRTTSTNMNMNTTIGGSIYDSVGSSTSTSLTDYYYDFKVKIKLDRRTIGYLIDTNSNSNPVILKTFPTQADFNAYMNLHSNYELIESQNYWTRTGYTSEAFHVRTAATLDEAQNIMDFIEDENGYSSFRFSLGYIRNR